MGVENNIPEGWKEVPLKEILLKSNQGVNTTTEKVIYSTKGHGVVKAQDILERKINFSVSDYVDKHEYARLSTHVKPKLNDILYSNIGSKMGNAAKVKSDFQFIIAWNVLRLQINTDEADVDFLVQLLNSKTIRRAICSLNSSSTMPFVSGGVIRLFEINLPPLPEQKAIAKVLTAFDDKIELLQAQNKTLETMAQTIFKEWFGKYQIGDELPDGWKVGKLGDISTHLKKNIKPFDNPEKRYCHYSLPAYDNGLKPITESGSEIKSNKYSVEKNTFLVSKLNPFTPRIWTIFDIDDSNICSTEFQVVKPNEASFFSITHCLLNSKYFTDNLSQKVKGTSSSHQRVNPEDIFEVDLIIPNKQDLIRFEKIVLPLITKKDINHNNIQSLTKTRDTLLPKLMSGQVRVKNLKQTADA